MWTRKLLFLAAGALALLLFAYGNHYQNSFHFDDSSVIVNNVSLHGPGTIAALLTDTQASGVEPASQVYRPVAGLSLALDYWLGKDDVAVYHRTAFALFLGFLVLLFLLFRNLSALHFDPRTSALIAFAAVLVTAFHAVNAETLNYINARGVLLAAIFSAASLLLYLHPGWTRKTRVYLIPLALAILSNQNAVCVVLLLFLHHLLFDSHKGEPGPRRLKRASLAALPALVIATLFLALVLAMSSREAQHYPSIEYVLTQPYVIAEYVAAFFYPIGLSAASGLSVFDNFDSWRSIAGQVFLICLIGLTALSLRGQKSVLIGFGLLWFVAALFPSSFLFSGEAALDYRRTFFAYPGLALGLCTAAALLVENGKLRVRSTKLVCAVLLILLGTHILLIRHRNRVWLNEETLWFDVIAKNPGFGPAYMSYGLSKMAKNDYDIARLYLEEALKYLPGSPDLNADLGTLHGKITKDPAVAERYFQHAIELDVNYSASYIAYGRWLLSRRMYTRAIEQFEKADALGAPSPYARYALMDTYSQLGSWAKVREVARLILTDRPEDSVALKHLAIADTRPAEDARRGVKSSAPPAQRRLDSSQTPG